MEENDTQKPLEEIEMGDAGQDKLMATLAYVGPLVIVSYLLAKEDSFARFHIKQGMVLFTAEVVLWFLMMTFWFLFPLWQLVNVVVFVLAIIGILNAIKGEEKELPLLGKYSDKFNI